VPIIALSANVLGEQREACLAAGMDGCLEKPIELRSLLDMLDRWLPLTRARPAPPRNSARRPKTRPAPAAANGPIDRSKLAEVSGGDTGAERDILVDFLATAESDMPLLKAAVEGADCAAIARMSHRMVGASRLVGATSLAEICAQMERASRAEDCAAAAACRGSLFQEIERVRDFLAQL
jgi:HPt (histidine-containing phosphotransfer) domain-containing protein